MTVEQKLDHAIEFATDILREMTIIINDEVPGSHWKREHLDGVRQIVADCGLLGEISQDSRFDSFKPVTGVRGGQWIQFEGGGSAVSDQDLATGLVARTAQLALLQGVPIEAEPMKSIGQESLRTILAVLKGDPAPIPRIVVLRNLKFTERLRTTFGDFIPGSNLALLSAINPPFGHSIFLGRTLSRVGTNSSAAQNPNSKLKASLPTARNERVLAQLAFVLAGEKVPVFGPQCIVWPFSTSGHMPISEEEAFVPTYGQETTIARSAHPKIVENANTLRTSYVKSLDTAYTRIVRAVLAPAHDHVSKLVDAVIAWEAMFSGQAETTLRVTASMALLLEPHSVVSREDLWKRLKIIYALRSSIVHGTIVYNEDDNSEIGARASEALDYAVRAMRAINIMPDNFRKLSSNERSGSLLIGTASTL